MKPRTHAAALLALAAAAIPALPGAAEVAVESFESVDIGAAANGNGTVVVSAAGATDGGRAVQISIPTDGKAKVFHAVVDNAFYKANPGVSKATGMTIDVTLEGAGDEGEAELLAGLFALPDGEQAYTDIGEAVPLTADMQQQTVAFMFGEAGQAFFDGSSDTYVQLEVFVEGDGLTGTLLLDNLRLVSEAPAEEDAADDAEAQIKAASKATTDAAAEAEANGNDMDAADAADAD